MDKAAHIAVNSIKADKIRQINLLHEMSNVSTVGFKKVFDIYSTTLRVDVEGTYGSRFLVTPAEINRVNLSPGSRITTNNELDIFVEGEGVLGVFNQLGNIAFTRRGDLQVSPDGLLKTGDGFSVADDGGGEIRLATELEYRIAKDGGIYSMNADEEVAEPVFVAQLMLRDASEITMEKMEDGLFKPVGTDAGDFTGGPKEVLVSNYALEGSSVKTYDVLTQMINSERAYEMKINIIKQLRELEESSSSLLQTA